MFRYIKLICFTAILALTGCSHLYGDNSVLTNRDTDYLRARSNPPLAIPPGMSSSTVETHYPVPDRNYPDSQKKVDLTPPELNSSASNWENGTTPALAKEVPSTTQHAYYDGYTRTATPGKVIGPLKKSTPTTKTAAQPTPTTSTAPAISQNTTNNSNTQSINASQYFDPYSRR